MNFEDGLVGHEEKAIKHCVRCVRGGTGNQTEVEEDFETGPN